MRRGCGSRSPGVHDMRRDLSGGLDRIVKWMARYSPPRHRELVRGMLAELDSLSDPAEQARFARGAIAAIARLSIGELGCILIDAPGRLAALGRPGNGAHSGGLSMSRLTTRQLLRRHATPFVVTLVSLTAVLLANHMLRRLPRLRANGTAEIATQIEVLVLSLPSTLALTVPVAVFVAVSWVFARLGREGVLSAAPVERHGVRRLIAPVVGVAAMVAALMLIVNTQLVPAANARLVTVLDGAPRAASDRTMTVGQLREAAREARASAGPRAAGRAAAYEVEIQKKFALAAASLILALAAAAVAIRFPHRGTGLVLATGCIVFAGYYFSLIAGEALADRHVISPLAGMWMANAFLLVVIVLLLWRPIRARPVSATGAFAIDG